MTTGIVVTIVVNCSEKEMCFECIPLKAKAPILYTLIEPTRRATSLPLQSICPLFGTLQLSRFRLLSKIILGRPSVQLPLLTQIYGGTCENAPNEGEPLSPP